jgi:alkylation response protein AidB-like acyl-CoA dehydrogenase
VLLEFNADQRLWQETVCDALAKQCPPKLIRSVVEENADCAPLWKSYIDMGWTELTDPANAVELAIVLEELGRVTDPTPFLATMTQFAPLAAGRHNLQQSGTAIYSGVTAHRVSNGWALNGTAHGVLDGDRAEQLAVVTEAGVFILYKDEVSARRSQTFDPVLHVAEVTIEDVRLPEGDRVQAHLGKARDVALAGMAMTIVGACKRILELTLQHVRDRHQFGVPIGSFQAIQHKMANIHVAIERARALSYFAALTIAADDPRRRLAAAMAKAAAGECQSLVFRHGLQSFGAMGFTWENDLQFALKRAKAGELLLGGAAEHRAMIAEEFHATHL